jgi:hypothetical protein
MIDELFQGYLPARVILLEGEVEEMVDSICRFLEFLQSTGRISEDSDPTADMIAHAERHIEDVEELIEEFNAGAGGPGLDFSPGSWGEYPAVGRERGYPATPGRILIGSIAHPRGRCHKRAESAGSGAWARCCAGISPIAAGPAQRWPR